MPATAWASSSALPSATIRPWLQDQDPVGELLRLVQVVGGEQDRGVLQIGQPVHQIVEVPPGGRVEAGGRLVQEQQFRPADDADRHVEPPSLTAGQRGDLLVAVLGQPDRLDQLVGGVGPRPVAVSEYGT